MTLHLADLAARQQIQRAEAIIASMRDYAIGGYRDGSICLQGLNDFLRTHGLEPYTPPDGEPDKVLRRQQAADRAAAMSQEKSSTQILTRLFGLTLVVWAAVVALAATREPRLVAVAGAFAIGFSHLAGRCGTSHLGALTPQGKIPGRRPRWLADILTYLASGAVASSLVGAGLAGAGGLLIPAPFQGAAIGLGLALALVAVSGDLGWLRWRLPEPKRQTRREWGMMFRPPVPAAMWGFGLGTTVLTVFTFSGVWLVLAMAVIVGEPAVGATLLLVHWIGRAVPIMAGPILLPDAASLPRLLDTVDGARNLFRLSNLLGTGLMALSLVLLLTLT